MKNSEITAQVNGDRSEVTICGSLEDVLLLYVQLTYRLASDIPEELMKLAFEFGIEESGKEENKK